MVDLNQHIRLSAENRRLFDTQLERDSQFLASCGIIDYSLLLGIHTVAGELPPAQPPAYGRYVPFWQRDWGGVLSEDKTQIYFMGVIDILNRPDYATTSFDTDYIVTSSTSYLGRYGYLRVAYTF